MVSETPIYDELLAEYGPLAMPIPPKDPVQRFRDQMIKVGEILNDLSAARTVRSIKGMKGSLDEWESKDVLPPLQEGQQGS